MSDKSDVFVALYEENKDKLMTYLMYRMSFDEVVCEDLFMDIVLKAYENFYTFDPEKGKFKSWLFRIAHNHLVNHWRDKKAVSSIEQMAEKGMEVGIIGAQENAIQQISHENIQKIFTLLKPHERDVLTLRYINDLSIEEIGEVMNKESGAIYTNLSRAKNQFKTFYKKLYSNEQS